MKLPGRTISRRKFLLAVGAGGAATAALVSQHKGTGSTARQKSDAASAGYHVTEHIRNYYRTAKV